MKMKLPLWVKKPALFWLIVILLSVISLGAAIGGPFEFGPAQTTFVRIAVIMGLLIVLLTSGLFIYTHRVCK